MYIQSKWLGRSPTKYLSTNKTKSTQAPSVSGSDETKGELDSSSDSDLRGMRSAKIEEEVPEPRYVRKWNPLERRPPTVFTDKPAGMPYMHWRLLRAVEANEGPEARSLIARVKDCNFYDQFGMTPLLHMCYNGNLELIQQLLKYGADLSVIREVDGYTCLHFAAISGNMEICRMLLDLGLDPLAQNKNKRTPGELALTTGHFKCSELINYYVTHKQVELVLAEAEETSSKLDDTDANSMQKLFSQVNLDPVRVAMSVHSLGLMNKLPATLKVLQSMCSTELASEKHSLNKVRAFRFFYMSWTLSQMLEDWEKHIAEPHSAELHLKSEMHSFMYIFVNSVLGYKDNDKILFLEKKLHEFSDKPPFTGNAWLSQFAKEVLTLRICRVQVALHTATIGSYAHQAYAFCPTCDNVNPQEICSICRGVFYCDTLCKDLHRRIHTTNCTPPTPRYELNYYSKKRKWRRHWMQENSSFGNENANETADIHKYEWPQPDVNSDPMATQSPYTQMMDSHDTWPSQLSQISDRV